MEIKLDFSILDEIQPREQGDDNKPTGKVYYKLEAEEKQKSVIAEAAAKQIEIYNAYQTAIGRAGQLTSDITKGIQEGQNIYNLFLKAVKCISLITGDEVFYEQAKKDIQAVYGIGITDNDAVMEIINAEEIEEFLNS